MKDMQNRVTGKQVARDAVTLVKDAGLFVFDLGRLIVFKIKCVLDERDQKRTETVNAVPKPCSDN